MLESIAHIDTLAIHAVQSVGPAWASVARLLSEIIGSTTWLAPAVIVALLLIDKRRAALETFIIFIASGGIIYALKHLIGAARPFIVDPSVIQYVAETGYGMPSGHAVLSVVILGWLWMRHPRSLSLSIGVPTLILLIGLSRIYLGVHYPSQVIAGWLIGAVLLGIFSWIDRTYFRRRKSTLR